MMQGILAKRRYILRFYCLKICSREKKDGKYHRLVYTFFCTLKMLLCFENEVKNELKMK